MFTLILLLKNKVFISFPNTFKQKMIRGREEIEWVFNKKNSEYLFYLF